MKEEIASSPPSIAERYSIEQIVAYFIYVLELVNDEYDMNILTPEEYFSEDLGEN